MQNQPQNKNLPTRCQPAANAAAGCVCLVYLALLLPADIACDRNPDTSATSDTPQPAPPPPNANNAAPDIRVCLIADTAAIAPGRTFQLALHYHIPDEWHIYWTNPGDAGLATEAQISAPQGFTVSQFRFPAPSRFTQPGDITGYGYQNSLMLIATVTAPDPLPDQSDLTFQAETAWLACRDVCIPGQATDQLTLPIASNLPQGNNLQPDPPPPHQALFQHWQRLIPTPAETSDLLISATITGRIPASGSTDLSATLEWASPPGRVDVFPETGRRVNFTHLRVNHANTRTYITWTASLIGPEDTPPEPAALVITAGRNTAPAPPPPDDGLPALPPPAEHTHPAYAIRLAIPTATDAQPIIPPPLTRTPEPPG